MAKPNYEKPNSQLDLERRQKSGNQSDRVLSTSDFAEQPEEENEPGYVGVDRVYQNSATVGGRPGMDSKGAEAKVFEQFTGEKSEDLDPEDEDEEEGTPTASAPSSSSSSTGS